MSEVKVKVTHYTQYPTHALPINFTSMGPTVHEKWPKERLTLKKHIQFVKIKFAKIIFLHKIKSGNKPG